jgi:hypothetical protein
MSPLRIDEARDYGVYFTSTTAQGWELDGRNQPRQFTKAQADNYVTLKNANQVAGTGTYATRKLDQK